MQQTASENSQDRHGPFTFRVALAWIAGLGVLLAVAGCGDSTPITPSVAKPFAGVSLTVRCADPAFAKAITSAAQSWATRTGARVTIRPEAMTVADDADIGIISTAELGVWAARDDLVSVPASLRAADHPFQWTGVLPPYREQLIEWGGQARAVPLAGDASVIVYRSDRLADANVVAAFQKKHNRKPAVPTTWEEFADIAAVFAELDGKPSIAPMTAPELAELFFRVAACYDRASRNDTTDAAPGSGLESLAFQQDLTTGAPRLETRGFTTAANWLASLQARKCLSPQAPGTLSDPVAALATDRSLAVVSLTQLAAFARLQRENGGVAAKLAIAPLPGVRFTADTIPNYVPYFTGGRLGVVRTRCGNPEAAFDLLAELGGPARSQEILSTPGLGAGPFRSAHLERDKLLIWLNYGFDADRSKSLQDALRLYLRPEVKNPVYGLRGPDQSELNAVAADEVAKVATGTLTAPDGMKALTRAWDAIDARTPPETRLRWRKLAAGVE